MRGYVERKPIVLISSYQFRYVAYIFADLD